MSKKKKQPNLKKTPKSAKTLNTFYVVSIIIILIVLGIFWTIFLYQGNYKNKIYPHVYINEYEVSGMTKQQIKDFLTKKTNAILSNGITLKYNNKKINIPSQVSDPLNPELSVDMWFYDVDEMVQESFQLGRKNPNTFTGKIKNTLDQYTLFTNSIHIEPKLHINEPMLREQLALYTQDYEISPTNSTTSIAQNTKGSYTVSVIPEQIGRQFDHDYITKETIKQLQNIKNPIINVSLETKIPDISKKDVSGLLPHINQLLSNRQNYTFTYKEKIFALTTDQLATMLTISSRKNKAMIDIDEEAFSLYIDKIISPSIHIEPTKAIFAMENQKVTEFLPGSDGQEVNIAQTKTLLQQALLSDKSKIELQITPLKTEIPTEKTNTLGIKELLGTGTSNFWGSPYNRRHNISVGAETLNGMIIKPDEEFSLLSALGEINGKTGYKTELVIKGNRTIPEYGGGLCQVGTTIFRTALDAGLPITERRNHSYRVRYYEPAGTDASIYNPSPDFKFLNDTGNHILVKTEIHEDTAKFEFWGTSDNRIIEQTTPIVYNIIPAGDTKYIESEDMTPGETKCIESPHDGATASFDYTVTYQSGEKKEQTFTSYYRPWPQVCLVAHGELPPLEEETTEE